MPTSAPFPPTLTQSPAPATCNFLPCTRSLAKVTTWPPDALWDLGFQLTGPMGGGSGGGRPWGAAAGCHCHGEA